jgi:phosphohistidine swiveling domain-containing protein
MTRALNLWSIYWRRKVGREEFHEDVARLKQEYEALARDIMKTLPEDEWPRWVKNLAHDWAKKPQAPGYLMDDQGTNSFPEEWLTNPDLGYFQEPNNDHEHWGKWKIAAGEPTPANYSLSDPVDLAGKQDIINNMQVNWWDMPPDQAKQAIVNAFRATMLSPRLNLKSNAIMYQELMNIPAEESDPDVFEKVARDFKAGWDAQGQGSLEQGFEGVRDTGEILPGKLLPGMWGNIRRLAVLGPYIDELYKDAMEDIETNGEGKIFRDKVLSLGIPGVGPKVASFAWLALAPTTSDLATIDVHMMRHLNEPGDAPKNVKHYMELENQLRDEKDYTYGSEVPLGQYQWGVWDKQRTPGWHQDHSSLRVYQPTPYNQIAWHEPPRPPRPQDYSQPEEQQQLFSRWEIVNAPKWNKIAKSYSIQGKIIASTPNLKAQGIAVRPDRQSQAEIMGIMDALSGHQEDSQRQKELIPEWALNRGGKVSVDFQRGPGGVGVTYAGAVICVSEWIDQDDNWLLEDPRCVGIVAEKGGASSHGATVARERNIPIVVDVPEANAIMGGDNLQIDSSNATIHVNGGGNIELGEAQVADLPIFRFVWSKGDGIYVPVPQEDPEGGILHKDMIKQQYRNGQWDMSDNAMGIIFSDGKVQFMGQPSDQQAMIGYLNTIYPITSVDDDFSI